MFLVRRGLIKTKKTKEQNQQCVCVCTSVCVCDSSFLKSTQAASHRCVCLYVCERACFATPCVCLVVNRKNRRVGGHGKLTSWHAQTVSLSGKKTEAS